MPLTTCPDCGHAVSDTAPSCPGCGRPMRPAPVVIVQKPQTGCFAMGCAGILGLFLFSWITVLCQHAPTDTAAPLPMRPSPKMTPRPAPSAAAQPRVPKGCAQHIELKSPAFWARELGQPMAQVLRSHRINLWSRSSSTGDKGVKVGEMIPGERAVILMEDPDDYQVKAPSGAIGWVGRIQVYTTLYQDVSTARPCKP